MAAQHRQPGLLLRGNDIENDAGFFAHTLDKTLPIGGAAAGFSGDRTREVHIAAAQFLRAHVERAECPVHRFIGEAARQREPFAQSHHATEGVDHGKVLAGRARDQQAAIIGAEVQRGIGLPPVLRMAATRKMLVR